MADDSSAQYFFDLERVGDRWRATHPRGCHRLIRPITLEEIMAGLNEIFATVETDSGLRIAFGREDRNGHKNSHTFYLRYQGPRSQPNLGQTRASPNQMWEGRLHQPLSNTYRPPTTLPTRGGIEVIRFTRSNRHLDLFGKRITPAEDQTHQYVTAIIKVRTRQITVITLDGEIIHQGDFELSQTLR